MTIKHLLFLLLLPHIAFSADILSRRIDVTFHNTRIQTALEEVAKMGQFEWSYNPKIIDPGKSITLVANDWTVREVLYEMLGAAYVFKTKDNYLIIKRQAKPSDEIIGYIRDPNTGKRVANATLYDKKTLRAVTTDSTGYYRLKVKRSSEVVVSRLGYRDTLFVVSQNTPRYQIIGLQMQDTVAAKTDAYKYAFKNVMSGMTGLFNATLDRWHDLNVQDSIHRKFQISFLPALGSNHVLSSKVENKYSINLIAGYGAGVGVLEVGGVANFIKNDVRGVQISGAFNFVNGNVYGVQVAGMYNSALDTLAGAQISGLANLAYYTGKTSTQVAGLFNYSGPNTEKGVVQVAGLANIGGRTDIAQVAGVANVSKVSNGVQIAGMQNRADRLNGVQISGAWNHAGKAKGVQIGIINTADDLDGIQIGLLNRSGRRWLPGINWGGWKRK